MTTPRVHAPDLDEERARFLWTRCGRYAVDAAHLASEAAAVTCADCLRALDGAELGGFRPELIVRQRYGARSLDAASERALAASYRQPSMGVRAWAKSGRHALMAWIAAHDEGSAMRSTCDPDRANRVQTSADKSLGGREHDAVERYASVGIAIKELGNRPLDLSRICPALTADQQLEVLIQTVAGRRTLWSTRADGKQQVVRRVQESPEDTARWFTHEHGWRLCHADRDDCGASGADSCWIESIRAVRMIGSGWTQWIAGWLRETGELRQREAPAPRRQERASAGASRWASRLEG